MIIIEKDMNYLDSLKSIAIKNRSLFQVEIDVTKKCNANCFFCYQGDTHIDKDEITFEEIKSLLKELKKLGTYYIGYSGGEPYARKDFAKIVECSKDLGFRVSIITNGHLMTLSDIDNLYRIGVERLTFSFHSTKRHIYNKHFGLKKGSNLYEKTVENIEYAKKIGLSVGIATTVTKYNIDDINDLLIYFERIGIGKEQINLNLLLEGNQNIGNYRPTKEQLYRNSKYFVEKENRNGFLCSAGIISCSIDSQGDVYPCTFFNTPVGNIKNTSLKEIWETSHYLQILRSIDDSKFSKCSDCEVKSSCNPCFVSNLNESGNIFIPSKSFCLSQVHKIGEV